MKLALLLSFIACLTLSSEAKLTCNANKSICVDAVKSGTNLEMRVETTHTQGWVGIGFGTKMDKADMILMGKDDSGKAKIINVIGQSNSIVDTAQYIVNPNVKTEDGKLVYSFVRPANDLQAGAAMIWALGEGMQARSHSSAGTDLKLDINVPTPTPPAPVPTTSAAPQSSSVPTSSYQVPAPTPMPGHAYAAPIVTNNTYANNLNRYGPTPAPANYGVNRPVFCRRRMTVQPTSAFHNERAGPTCTKSVDPIQATPNYGSANADGNKPNYGGSAPNYGEANPPNYGGVRPTPTPYSGANVQSETSASGYNNANGAYNAGAGAYQNPASARYGSGASSSVNDAASGPTTTKTPCTTTQGY